MSEKQNWWQLSSIQIGGAICLPVIMIGHTLAENYGFISAMVSILIGNALLFLLGLVTSKMSIEQNKTTAENARQYFGNRGTHLFCWAMLVSLLGWFGLQLNMISLSILDLFSLPIDNHYFLIFSNIILGLLMTFVALYGVKGMGLFADICFPLLLGTLFYALITSDKPVIADRAFSVGGTSVIIAMAILMVIDLPTFFRHAKSYRDGYISIGLIFFITLPILEMAGVYLASGNPNGGILEILKRQDGPIWNVWVASFLVLAGWTTNNLNVYSAVVSLETLWPSSSEKMRTLFIGLFGTGLACFDLLKHLEFCLDLIGVFISSMGAVIISSYIHNLFYPQKTKDQKLHLFCWAIGIGCGLLSIFKFFSGIPVLDSTIGASASAFLILFYRKGAYEKAYS